MSEKEVCPTCGSGVKVGCLNLWHSLLVEAPPTKSGEPRGEAMTAEEFWNRNKNAFMFRPFSVVMRFAEAYASHVTASQDARVERLEKALQQIADTWMNHTTATEIARKALEGDKGD